MKLTLLVAFALAAPLLLTFGVSQLILRRAQVAARRHPGHADDFLAAFDEVHNELERLPDEIPDDKVPSPHQLHFERLAEKLRSRGPAFQPIAADLQQAADILGALSPLREKVGPLLQNTTLQLKKHFDSDIAEQVRQIRVAAQAEDLDVCARAVAEVKRYLAEWSHRAMNWLNLRQIAATGITERAKAVEVAGGWLQHGAMHIFADAKTSEEFVWWPWFSQSRPDLLESLTSWVQTEIEHADWDFEAICTLSSTGAPVATLLSMRLKKRFLPINDAEPFRFLPGANPTAGERVVLVDSLLQTGKHLEEAVQTIEGLGSSVAGAIFVCENDLLPEDQERLPIAAKMLARRALVRLFCVSELYEIWQASRLTRVEPSEPA